MKKLSILFFAMLFIVCIAAQAFAAVSSVNNNFTMINGSGGVTGGTNDVVFTWDLTKKTSVVASGQVSNATLSSTTPFFGVNWVAHDLAIYGPGTYTVYDGCPAGGPGCGTGNAITFTVGTGQLGAHMLFDWGGSNDIDVVDVWVPNAVFGPSPLFTGPDGTIAPFGNPATVWSYMSKDWDGDGFNGFGMTDGPFLTFNANFNVNVVGTENNNFTMINGSGGLTGGTNDVIFTWNGTKLTSVAASGQVSNATLSSVTPFFGVNWSAHDLAIYGPGTYTVYDGCVAGSPGCGTGNPITFTITSVQLGAHMLFDWGGSTDIDVVDVWVPNAVFGPSPMFTGPDGTTPPFGDPATVWNWMSSDWNLDGFNGFGMTDGPFATFNANFNVMGVPPVAGCVPADCNDNNACTLDACVGTTCTHTTINCNDNNICTTDGCNTATGCTHTAVVPASCNDNNVCTTDTCTNNTCGHTAIALCCTATGQCNDGNVCTTDSCNLTTNRCVFTPPGTCSVSTTLNNFTMVDPTGKTIGGTQDVVFAWDGSKKTSVAASGQVSNAILTSTCPFQGITWSAHDVAIYGPGSYTVYAGCASGSPGCGLGTAMTFTVGATELGVHMLFNWGASSNIDVIDVWSPTAVFAPSALWTGACGSQVATKVWDWMSKDFDGDTINGKKMVDGPFLNFNANFNVMGGAAPPVCVPADCSDNNACTLDSCNTATGVCSHTAITCNDNNACTTDTCNTATGCVFTPIVCNDNNACTTDTCNTATGCVFTTLVCNDNNICTTDTCNTATGCVFTATIPASCNDNNACTTDGCTANACTHVTIVCNDNNACTTDTCNSATGCVFTTLVCNDNNICTVDTCNTATGCVFTPTMPASCNDNNACTTDGCTNNACTHVTITCNDNNACTTDTCNTATGCVFTPVVCNDNNACTTDTCNTVSGCIFTPVVCNDNNACTTDTCNTATGCVFTPIVCNDNNACTTDTCNTATGCVFTTLVCNDNNICTTDTCNTATGCVFTATVPASCNDNNACTTDGCTANACTHVTITCNDNNLCTTDSCNTATGCAFAPVSCPTGQSCDPVDGVCKACTSAAQCNDNNACTVDTCNTATGCVHTPVVCNDNNACTTDTCNTATGACVFTPIVCNDNNACTTDTCNTTTGCVFTTLSCDDNNICTTDSCNTATGCLHTATIPASCNDNNACTTDGCTANACTHANITCNDNNACTADTCAAATGCVFTPITCNDNLLCTVDTCNTATGCVFTPKTCPTGQSCDTATGNCTPVSCVPADCNDNNACTDDVCNTATSVCMHTAKNCNDGNLCTTDSCNTATGCVNTPIVCNDNNACTTDSCNSAQGCVYTPIVCNDSNVCTTDSCNSATGACVYTPNTAICPQTSNNNFTMIDPTNTLSGGTNDVVFAWDGTKKTSVAATGQVSNALLSSTCPFFGVNWAAHDVTVYGPGTYTVYSGCAAGSPGCGTGAPITYTVKAGEIALHMLFDWGGNNNLDVVNVMKPNAISTNMWTGACGSNAACTVWAWASYDFDGDGINGTSMVDGPFIGMNPNFNLNKVSVDLCCDAATRCNDNNSCTVDTCNSSTGACVNTLNCSLPGCAGVDPGCPAGCIPADCNDGNVCTTDACVAGVCQHTPISCNDNNACTMDSCDPATGCVHNPIVCNDNNACTTDTCSTATGCVFTTIVCNDNNACTTDTCSTATGCVYSPKVCNDNNLCTTDSCNTTTGACVFTPVVCNDNNKCTTDSCNTATGLCVYTELVCNDNSKCTTDTCVPATGCVYTPIVCTDNNPCTNDTCVAATGCVFTPKVCDDSNTCTTDSCNSATGACVYTPVPDATICTIGTTPGVCQSGTCVTPSAVCPKGSKKKVALKGTGSVYWWVEYQIVTEFTVKGSGCILRYTSSTITATPNTVLKVNWKEGIGPKPTSVTWKGTAVPVNPIYWITCPSTTGVVGDLVLSNTSARHGKDTDTLTVSVATN